MDTYPSTHDDCRSLRLITVRGDIGLATSGDLLLRLLILVGTATGQVALDPPEVASTGSPGLSTLITLDQQVCATSAHVGAAATSPAVARMFELVGLGDDLTRALVPTASGARGVLPHMPEVDGDPPSLSAAVTGRGARWSSAVGDQRRRGRAHKSASLTSVTAADAR